MLSVGDLSQKKKGPIGEFLIRPLHALIVSGILPHIIAYLSQIASLNLGAAQFYVLATAVILMVLAVHRLYKTHDFHPYFLLFIGCTSTVMLATFLSLAIFEHKPFQIIWSAVCAGYSILSGYYLWQALWDFDYEDSSDT